MSGFLDVENGRDVGLDSCAGRAGVLGDQAVTAVGQNPGLTARNSSHDELTAIDESADHRTRGDAQTPRDSGLRNPLASSLEQHEPHKRTGVYYQDTRCSGGSFPKRNLAASFLARAWFHQVCRLFIDGK